MGRRYKSNKVQEDIDSPLDDVLGKMKREQEIGGHFDRIQEWYKEQQDLRLCKNEGELEIVTSGGQCIRKGDLFQVSIVTEPSKDGVRLVVLRPRTREDIILDEALRQEV
jgi:hypothetical protein